MKVLVLATDYPDLKGNCSSFFIHTRSIFYKKNGIDVEVLNFSSKEDYVIDNIKVITFDTYKQKNNKEYNILILHAPNLRNHYKFLKKYGKLYNKHLFFFHGHEVLKINKDYSEPYEYMKKKITIMQDAYDFIKLKMWKKYFIKNMNKSYYIFVSNWMKDMFLKNLKLKENNLNNDFMITYNSIGETFETQTYDASSNKEYDYITIRSNLDGSKYCIDIINKLAYQNPKLKFLVIGKGIYFDIYEKAQNIKFLNKNCNHNEIIEYLNKSKYALMPTRTDAQGVMACEIATFGMPLITSSIPVCKEVFDSFVNVAFIDNDNIENVNLNNIYKKILKKRNILKNEKYFLNKNCINEIEFMKKLD